MSGKQTFTIIKPDAVKRNLAGAILQKMNEAGFEIKALQLIQMTREQARSFYEVHKERPFYAELTEFMSSGPVVVAILQKEDAVAEFRKLIGATDPAEAEEGTIRKLFAESKARNAVHGSDSDENAIIESDFFFSKTARV
ncbi:MAG: nucleoside-diphosphate kinase [Prolixibacteraceae bacterium]